jgi:hypothetical protein
MAQVGEPAVDPRLDHAEDAELNRHSTRAVIRPPPVVKDLRIQDIRKVLYESPTVRSRSSDDH